MIGIAKSSNFASHKVYGMACVHMAGGKARTTDVFFICIAMQRHHHAFHFAST